MPKSSPYVGIPHSSPRIQGLPPPPTFNDFLTHNDLPPGRLLQLERDLNVHNANEELVSYDAATDTWVPWSK